jgi:hypothetical protein
MTVGGRGGLGGRVGEAVRRMGRAVSIGFLISGVCPVVEAGLKAMQKVAKNPCIHGADGPNIKTNV